MACVATSTCSSADPGAARSDLLPALSLDRLRAAFCDRKDQG